MELVDLDEIINFSDDYYAVDLQAGKYYSSVTPWDITVDITPPPSSLQETVLKFTMGTGSIVFSIELTWVNEPSLEAGKTYLISIVNNIAVAAEVTV
jgi:hypothetical protein